LSIHSFTPKLDGQVRNCDVGILYDPKRPMEKTVAADLKRALVSMDGVLRVRWNYPYRGIADGFTTHLRKRFSKSRYAGIEIEINQQLPLGDSARWHQFLDNLGRAVERAV
jgi:predicted N-formylglutamate amidohydrolase